MMSVSLRASSPWHLKFRMNIITPVCLWFPGVWNFQSHHQDISEKVGQLVPLHTEGAALQREGTMKHGGKTAQPAPAQ